MKIDISNGWVRIDGILDLLNIEETIMFEVYCERLEYIFYYCFTASTLIKMYLHNEASHYRQIDINGLKI